MQANNFSCGAAALLSVLYYWQAYEGTETSLYPLLHTTEEGTEPTSLVEVARLLGLEASYKEGMTISELRAAIRQGDTVILAIQAWHENSEEEKIPPPWTELWDDGHYVVLIGMDQANAYFMDPSAGASYGYIPIPELLDRWHDYENQNGRIWRYFNLGVTIRGTRPLAEFPDRLIHID